MSKFYLCTRQARDDALDKEEDSGSETGSESLLEPQEGGPQVPIVKEKLAVVEETFICEEASEPSSDLLQPTQVGGNLCVRIVIFQFIVVSIAILNLCCKLRTWS